MLKPIYGYILVTNIIGLAFVKPLKYIISTCSINAVRRKKKAYRTYIFEPFHSSGWRSNTARSPFSELQTVTCLNSFSRREAAQFLGFFKLGFVDRTITLTASATNSGWHMPSWYQVHDVVGSVYAKSPKISCQGNEKNHPKKWEQTSLGICTQMFIHKINSLGLLPRNIRFQVTNDMVRCWLSLS